MLRLALLGLLAFGSQVNAECNAGPNTNYTSPSCRGTTYFNPSDGGIPGGPACLQNTSYALQAPKCQFGVGDRGFQVTFYTCPAADSDGYLVFETDSGSTTIKAADCVKFSAKNKNKTFVGYGAALNFYLVQNTKPFVFILTIDAIQAAAPTTTTVLTTRAIPTIPTASPESAKLDLIVVVDLTYNLPSSIQAIHDIVSAFLNKVNPVNTADSRSFIRVNPIFVGSTPFQFTTWTATKATFLSLLDAFAIVSDTNSAENYGQSSYTQIGSFVQQSFESKNKNVRDHTTRAVLIFTSNDTAAEDTWATEYIAAAQKYDVHTVIVPVDSDVTNIEAQLKFPADVSTAPIYYGAIDSTNYTAGDVVNDIHDNFLLNGVKLCNIKCSSSTKQFKLPNVPTMFAGNNYCANIVNFRCALKDLFASSNCDFSQEVTVKMTEFDIDAGLDSLNFYEFYEIESFSGFKVMNSVFEANATDGYFVFNSVPSSVYGGFDMSITCTDKPATAAPTSTVSVSVDTTVPGATTVAGGATVSGDSTVSVSTTVSTTVAPVVTDAPAVKTTTLA